MKKQLTINFLLAASILMAQEVNSNTIALWVFDEQAQIYPSCVLSDISKNGSSK
jgi:hypothetical protein